MQNNKFGAYVETQKVLTALVDLFGHTLRNVIIPPSSIVIIRI